MAIDPNDPQLTAYALGEISDQEREIFESALRESLPARGEVDRIHASARLVAQALDSEPLPRLTDLQRVGIESHISEDAGAAIPAPVLLRRMRVLLWTVAGVAASVAALVLSLPLLEWRNSGNAKNALDLQNVPATVPIAVRPSNPAVPATQPIAPPDESAAPAPGAYAANDPGPSSGGSEIGAIPDSYSVADLPSVTMQVSHDFLGDLNITLGQDGTNHYFAADTTWHLQIVESERSNLSGRLPSLWSGDQDWASGPQHPTFTENPFYWSDEQPVSTFSADVDTASYTYLRKSVLGHDSLPPRDAVRIEELVNYFDYDYPAPEADAAAPFATNIEIADCPWDATHRLARIGLKGREITLEQRPACNLVFLLDVSGSMQPEDRLPLIKESLKELVANLQPSDRVSIVTYADGSSIALPSTAVRYAGQIYAAIDGLKSAGGTNGGSGIQLAYDIATKNFIQGGANRVILGTDGDFNVGITDRDQLVQLVADRAASGVFLSVLGVGGDNLRDATLQQLADKGNGHYVFVDDRVEAQRVLVAQMSGTLVTIAKDVKIQVQFNPSLVAAYRLIGYEKRALNEADFNDDTKDAGDIGAGHTVTALYELVPAGWPVPVLEFIANPPTSDGRATLSPRLVDVCRYGYASVPSGAHAAATGTADGPSTTNRDASNRAFANSGTTPSAASAADQPNGLHAPRMTGTHDNGSNPSDASVGPVAKNPATSGKNGEAFAAATPQPDARGDYSSREAIAASFAPNDLLVLKLRYKEPDADVSRAVEFTARDGGARFSQASEDFRFQASVTAFGMALRESPYRGDWPLEHMIDAAQSARGKDVGGYRAEFIDIMRKSHTLGAR